VSDSGVTPQDVYRFVERKLQHQKRRWQKLHRQAAGDAERIVRYIIEKYKPKRIIQWGSLLKPEQFRDYSDIDLALEGIPDAETFFRLTGEIEKLTSFPLDVVQWEHLEPEFREVILHKGKVVYESPE